MGGKKGEIDWKWYDATSTVDTSSDILYTRRVDNYPDISFETDENFDKDDLRQLRKISKVDNEFAIFARWAFSVVKFHSYWPYLDEYFPTKGGFSSEIVISTIALSVERKFM